MRCALLIVATLAATNVHAMSALEWLSRCEVFTVVTIEDRKSLTPENRLLLQKCKREAAVAWCRAGYIAVKKIDVPESRQTEVNETLPKACPHPLFESRPMEIALDYWSKRSLPFWRRWLSSENILLEAYAARWPACISARRRLAVLPGEDDFEGCVSEHIPVWGK